MKINWFNYKTITVVASSKGYPWKTDKPSEIKNLKNLKISNNEYIFHAGTFYKNGKIFSTGGRTLNITTKDKNLKNARAKCHIILKKISWKNKYYRKDIGWRAIN
ncbi:MAG: phosphoribosylglycinamide synthetase C domain-containing protein [Candidatus Fonsibacter sp.]